MNDYLLPNVHSKTEENVFSKRSYDYIYCNLQILSTFDMIFMKVRNSTIFMGGVLLVFSMDHTQIQPITEPPFFTSSHIVPCFKMIALNHSITTFGDLPFQKIQQISRHLHYSFWDDPNLVEEFINLCSEHLTFLDTWEDDNITPSAMRLYSRKVPTREAVH